MKSKKGFIGDVAFIIGVLFVLVLVVTIGFKVLGDFNDKYQTSGATNVSKELLQEQANRYVGLWDGIFMLVFGLLTVGLIISVAALGSRPEFFFIILILGMFIIGGAAMFSNIYEDATSGSLAVSASNFSFSYYVMTHMVEISLLLIGLFIVGLFVKAGGLV